MPEPNYYLAFTVRRRAKYGRTKRRHAVRPPVSANPCEYTALCGVRVSEPLDREFYVADVYSCPQCIIALVGKRRPAAPPRKKE